MLMSLLRCSMVMALAATGCAVGSPLGFSSGNSWSFPLVAPLEGGVYLVPVKVNGKGPYLFMIDPDAPVSSIDAAIASDLNLYMTRTREELDERDRRVPITLAEVAKLKVGDKLTVSTKTVRVHKFGTYWAGGRRVRGVLGRDIIADSLVFAANRDLGIATLAVQGHLSPPPDAKVIKYRRHRHQLGAPRRRLISARIHNNTKTTMHLDPGARHSMLWPKQMQALNLPKIRVQTSMTDEVATTRTVDYGAMVAMVKVGDVQVNGIRMVPYADKRTREIDLDGSLGQSFFRNYNLTINWHKKTFWLKEREANVANLSAERLRRWGPAFDKCKNPACVEVVVISDQPPPAPPPPPVPDAEGGEAVAPAPLPPPPARHTLRITREAGAADREYEILLEAVDEDGKPIGVPRLLATLRKGRSVVELADLDPGYAQAASLHVIDLSPFPRECKTGPCVWALPMN